MGLVQYQNGLSIFSLIASCTGTGTEDDAAVHCEGPHGARHREQDHAQGQLPDRHAQPGSPGLAHLHARAEAQIHADQDIGVEPAVVHPRCHV